MATIVAISTKSTNSVSVIVLVTLKEPIRNIGSETRETITNLFYLLLQPLVKMKNDII